MNKGDTLFVVILLFAIYGVYQFINDLWTIFATNIDIDDDERRLN